MPIEKVVQGYMLGSRLETPQIGQSWCQTDGNVFVSKSLSYAKRLLKKAAPETWAAIYEVRGMNVNVDVDFFGKILVVTEPSKLKVIEKVYDVETQKQNNVLSNKNKRRR